MGPNRIKKTPPLGAPTWDFSNIATLQGRTAQPTWRYHGTSEDALKHDLGALKKGEIYERNDFYKRAKAWFKAEIDRKLYLHNLEKSSDHHPSADGDTQPTSPLIAACYFPPVTQEPPNADSSKPAAIRKDNVPTRIQPSRAAKHKLPPTAAAPVRKKPATTTQKKAGAADFLHKGGDYTLDPYDWTRSLIRRDSGLAGRFPRGSVYTQPGTEIAHFTLRLERAIATKISQIHTDGYIQRWKAGKLGCALNTAGKRRKYKLPKESNFQPAAAILPGEDWPETSPSSAGLPTLERLVDDLVERVLPGHAENMLEVVEEEDANIKGRGRLEVDVKRSMAGTPVPEATMETSSTPGRWPDKSDDGAMATWNGGCEPPAWLDKERKERERREKVLKANPTRPIVEKLERDCRVVVSGLKFAVDLCKSENGSEEGARFVML